MHVCAFHGRLLKSVGLRSGCSAETDYQRFIVNSLDLPIIALSDQVDDQKNLETFMRIPVVYLVYSSHFSILQMALLSNTAWEFS